MAQTFNFIVKIPDQEPIQYVLDAQKVTIGRHPTNDIQILVAEVSGMHAVLERTDAGYTITELGSSNGTKVNGERIGTGTPIGLNHEDKLLLGETINVDFVRDEAQAEEEPQVAVAVAVASAPTPPALKRPALKLAKKMPAAAVAASPSVRAESPAAAVVSPASPTVVLNRAASAPPVSSPGSKTVSLVKTGLPQKPPATKLPVVPQQVLRPPVKELAPAPIAAPIPVAEVEPEPEFQVVTPRKLQPPPPKPVEEPAPAEEKPKLALKLAKKKLAAPSPAPIAETEAEPTPSPAAAETALDSTVEAQSEAAPATEAAGVVVPTPLKKPSLPAKLAKKKLAAPAAKISEPNAEAAPAIAEPETGAEPAPVEIKTLQKPKLPVKLAQSKPAPPIATVESEIAAPEKPIAVAPLAAQLDQDSKGVTLIRKSAAPADPEATPVLRKSDVIDDVPPSLVVKTEVGEITLKKVTPVADDAPPKLVVPKKVT